MNGTISYVINDDEWQRDFELTISYAAYAAERATNDYPGSPAFAEWHWALVSIVDWTYSAKHGVEISIKEGDEVVNRWLQDRLDLPAIRADINARCLQDASDQEESARERYDDERLERARLGER